MRAMAKADHEHQAEHIPLEKVAYIIRAEGAEAHRRGVLRSSNPCVPNSVFWRAWEEGWDLSAATGLPVRTRPANPARP
jgi:hypothetical protein